MDWQRELQEVYGHVEKVDLLVGMHAETPPPGFAISDTAFRIFILMAGRRIKSDRFFTDDFTPEVYTAGRDRLGRAEPDAGRGHCATRRPSPGTSATSATCSFPGRGRGAEPVARRYRIPGLIDLTFVSDPEEIRTLAADPALDRRFERRGPLVNRLVAGRIRRWFQVDGRPIPPLSPRGDADRAARQKCLAGAASSPAPASRSGPSRSSSASWPSSRAGCQPRRRG